MRLLHVVVGAVRQLSQEQGQLRVTVTTLLDALAKLDRLDDLVAEVGAVEGRMAEQSEVVASQRAAIEKLTEQVVGMGELLKANLAALAAAQLADQHGTVGGADEPQQQPTVEPVLDLAESGAKADDDEEHVPTGATDLAIVLMQAYRSVVGGPTDPADKDYRALRLMFNVAMEECFEVKAAVRKYASWLAAFNEQCAEDADRSPYVCALAFGEGRLG